MESTEKKKASKNTMGMGCIKRSRGPWIIRRRKKDGGMSVRYRFPSEKEREINKEREVRRRQVAKNIFEGLRKHGNYKLPKHPNTNHLLMALCEEAGWHVQEDGSIFRKQQEEVIFSLVNTSFCDAEEDHCHGNSNQIASKCEAFGSTSKTEELSLSLSLSLSLPSFS